MSGWERSCTFLPASRHFSNASFDIDAIIGPTPTAYLQRDKEMAVGTTAVAGGDVYYSTPASAILHHTLLGTGHFPPFTNQIAHSTSIYLAAAWFILFSSLQAAARTPISSCHRR